MNRKYFKLPEFRLPEVFFNPNEPTVCVIPFTENMIRSVRNNRNRRPEIKKSLDFKKIKTTSRVASKLESYIKKMDNDKTTRNDIVIGGSAAAFTQVRGARRPNDPDLEASNQQKAKRDIVAILKKKYPNVTTRSMKREDGRTYIQVLSNGEPIVDIKPMDKPGHKIQITSSVSVKEHAPIKIGNIFYERSSDLLAKKAKAIHEDYYVPIFSNQPVKERICKDTFDFASLENSFDRNNLQFPKLNFFTKRKMW